MNEEKIQPVRLTDHNGVIHNPGDVYELDFNRESIVFAESRGFKLDDVGDFPVTGISNLFYFSFRAHHRSVSKEKTGRLMDEWGGLPENVLRRLIDLYNQAVTANNIQTDEEAEKNSAVSVEM